MHSSSHHVVAGGHGAVTLTPALSRPTGEGGLAAAGPGEGHRRPGDQIGRAKAFAGWLR
jgi:hypothetical protein